jgi:hypothetical protein
MRLLVSTDILLVHYQINKKSDLFTCFISHETAKEPMEVETSVPPKSFFA